MEEEKIFALQAIFGNVKILVNKNKGKVHLKDDDEGDPSKKDNFLQNKRNTYHGTDPWWILQENIQVTQLVVIGKYLMLRGPSVSAIVYSGEQYRRQKRF